MLPPAFPVISTPLSVLAALPAGEWSLLQDDWAPGLGCGFCGRRKAEGGAPAPSPRPLHRASDRGLCPGDCLQVWRGRITWKAGVGEGKAADEKNLDHLNSNLCSMTLDNFSGFLHLKMTRLSSFVMTLFGGVPGIILVQGLK